MKTVIEMAREAGFQFNKYGLLQGDDDNEIDADAMFERLVELVRADEREALVESINWTALMRQGGVVTWGDAEELGYRVVAAIRARSNT